MIIWKSFAVDEKLYSRQLYVMGHEAQRRMMASKALVVGMSGLGVEVAKNCILAGISSLVLLDPTPPNSFDLGGNFYLSENMIGSSKGRAILCRDNLAELNPYVNVSVAEGVSSLDGANAHAILALVPGTTCVVVTVPLPTELLKTINLKCRAEGSCFIYGTAVSVFGQIFCDFGSSFVVSDKDGENPASAQVESIIPTDPIVVKVLEDHGRHGLESGDVVTFARVKELPVLNEVQFTVKVTGPYTFELESNETTKAILASLGGDDSKGATQGYITQVKQPVTVNFTSYEESLETSDQEFMLSDFAKFDRPPVLFLAFKTLAAYLEKHYGKLPPANDKSAAVEFVELATSLDKENVLGENNVNVRLLKHFAFGAQSVLSPMCAFLGGFVGQEVLKACSGKFMPIKGFFFFDAAECLPMETDLPADEVAISGTSRYDSQTTIFGKSLQEKICNLNYFLVGAGAIGCEMLKNWAMMGVGCGDAGKIYVTDMDTIEKSNLSRQFLFRNKDIGEFKSTTAAKAAAAMNPGMQVISYQEKVAASTENVFGDKFFDTMDGVCTALDNVEARLYVDQRCLFYRMPMLESGTLGTKGNTQVVVPRLTENYGATRDPPEKSIPVCTLKNFPNQIQHTLQWARDYFEGVFKQNAEDVNGYLSTGEKAEFAEALSKQPNKADTLRSVHACLVDERPRSFDDCIIWARLKFDDMFSSQIKQLLHNFPEDQVTSTGQKFWSGSKRCPEPLVFDTSSLCGDAEMNNHLDFVVAAANLRAHMFGIKGNTDREHFKQVLSNAIVPEFAPRDGVKIAANESEAKEESLGGSSMDVDDEVEKLVGDLPKPSSLAGFRLQPIDFDKDVDEHMLFVTACSNLRALNYGIPTEDTHKSRAIAGKIIPAIATTTALVTGLICLELFKIVGTARKELKIEDFKNGFVNLAIPFMTVSEPQPPVKTKTIVKGEEWEWTPWDSLDMNMGDITLAQFMEFFKTEYNSDVSMVSHGVSILYSFFANKQKVAERMKMTMSEVVQNVTKKEIPDNQLFLIFEIIANDIDTDEEVELPYVKFRFR
jgi:ubiquitin-activating enzyme E1